jgi:hypothetical protein
MAVTAERTEQIGPYSKQSEGSPSGNAPKDQSAKRQNNQKPLISLYLFQPLLTMFDLKS